MTDLRVGHFLLFERSGSVVQKKLPLINSAHGSDTRNIINELIRLFNNMGYTYDEALNKAQDILEEAQQTNDMNENVQQQINTLIAESGTSDAEVVQARIDAEGNEYPVLKERLDKSDEFLSTSLKQKRKFENQTDFIRLIENLSSYDRMRFSKLENGKYCVVLDDGKKHITYNFVKDDNDDYIKVGECFTGELFNTAINPLRAENMTGDFQGSQPNMYTTEEGASFEVEGLGTKFYLSHYADDRGGVWEFVIDDDYNNPVQISTYSDDIINNTNSLIVAGLEYKNHKLVATFKGADPENPPRGGTARGWFEYRSSLSGANTIPRRNEYDNTIQTSKLLHETSNKEMAISITDLDTSTSNWLPDHGVGTVYHRVSPKFEINGAEIDVDSLYDGEMVTCHSFKLHQTAYAKFPESSGEIANILMTYHVNKDGTIKYNGSMEVLKDLRIGVAYPLMIPANQGTIPEVLTGVGSRRVADASNEYYYFEDDRELTQNACFISSTNTNLIAAGKIEAPLMTLRLSSDEGKQTAGESLKLWQRDPTPKLYWEPIYRWNINAGQRYSWSGQIAIGNIRNIYEYVTG